MSNQPNPVSPVAPSATHWHYPTTRTPDDSFYRDYQTAYAANIAMADARDERTQTAPLQNVLEREHVERRSMAGVGIESQASFAAVLNKAYAGNAMADPQKFLQSLSMQEMEALRINHGLADSINAGQLSKEGASNLLLPAGYSVDLNHDGLEEVGAGRIMHFPPRDAPAGFVTKWQEATANMDPGDEMTYCFEMHAAIFGFHIDEQTPPPHLASDKMESYRAAITNLLENLEMSKHLNTPEWYEKNKAFYSQLQALIA
jgi:hypothetical protein